MNIKNIAIQLSGEINGKEKISRLEFFELLEKIYWFSFEKLNFYWKQSQENEENLYFLILEMLFSRSKKDGLELNKFNKLLNSLWIIEKEDNELFHLNNYDIETKEWLFKNYIYSKKKDLFYKSVFKGIINWKKIFNANCIKSSNILSYTSSKKETNNENNENFKQIEKESYLTIIEDLTNFNNKSLEVEEIVNKQIRKIKKAFNFEYNEDNVVQYAYFLNKIINETLFVLKSNLNLEIENIKEVSKKDEYVFTKPKHSFYQISLLKDLKLNWESQIIKKKLIQLFELKNELINIEKEIISKRSNITQLKNLIIWAINQKDFVKTILIIEKYKNIKENNELLSIFKKNRNKIWINY